MRRVLIANRGEIAIRAIRAARRLGLETVSVHSTADASSAHVWAADRSVCIGPPPANRSYLDAKTLIHVAATTGCDAVYPGYGFLSERAGFAAACEIAGLKFIGPSAEVIACMGDKARAKATAAAHGVPLVPGSAGAVESTTEALAIADEIGFPVLLKARAGGGGKGMRVAHARVELPALLEQASREAAAAFGDGAIYLERWLSTVRHVEVQIMADRHGNVRALGERDCSIQRRHQKLIEEAPAAGLPAATRRALIEASERLAAGIGYEGAGTIEYVYDEATDRFHFIEMNTRIQVEHPVTEMIIGHDLVREQFRIARGERLEATMPPTGPVGHAIEMRINAEDWTRDFRPSPGRISHWRAPGGPGVRMDTYVGTGASVPPHYDSLIAKLIVQAATRDQALERARRALEAFEVEGIATTKGLHAALLTHPDVIAGRLHTRWLEEAFPLRPAAAAAHARGLNAT